MACDVSSVAMFSQFKTWFQPISLFLPFIIACFCITVKSSFCELKIFCVSPYFSKAKLLCIKKEFCCVYTYFSKSKLLCIENAFIFFFFGLSAVSLRSSINSTSHTNNKSALLTWGENQFEIQIFCIILYVIV